MRNVVIAVAKGHYKKGSYDTGAVGVDGLREYDVVDRIGDEIVGMATAEGVAARGLPWRCSERMSPRSYGTRLTSSCWSTRGRTSATTHSRGGRKAARRSLAGGLGGRKTSKVHPTFLSQSETF